MFLSPFAPSHLSHPRTFVAPLRFTDPTGLCVKAYCGTESVTVKGSLEYVPPGSGSGWGYWPSPGNGGMACGNPPNDREGWVPWYDGNGNCYGWEFQGSDGWGSAGPVPSTQTGPPTSPEHEERDDPAQPHPPPCQDAFCEMARGTAKRTAPFSSMLDRMASVGLQAGSMFSPWIALGHCAIIGCSPGEVTLAAMPLRGLGNNPFAGKTAGEIGQMLTNKGYRPMGPNPTAGAGTFVNPNTGRSYHIDAAHGPPKGPHVGVHRRCGFRDTMSTRDYPLGP